MSKLSQILTHHWGNGLSVQRLFFSQVKKVPGKTAPMSLSAWHRKTWYETDTKGKRERRESELIWQDLCLNRESENVTAAAHLQTSNIPV